MQIPMQFYQTTASVIPTLMIAVVLGARQGDRFWQGLEKLSGFKKRIAFIAVAEFIVVIVLGELQSLISIIHGSNDPWPAIWVVLAIVEALGVVIYEWMRPASESVEPVYLIGIAILVPAMMFIAFVIFILDIGI